jgi:DNA-binding PadR family transcriptional regulator
MHEDSQSYTFLPPPPEPATQGLTQVLEEPRQESQAFVLPIGTQPAPKDDGLPTPAPPNTMAETGITESTVEQLIIKQLYFKGEAMGREIAISLGFKYSVIETLIDTLKRNHLISAKRSMGMGNISSVFALSEAGRKLAQQYMEINTYAGAAPVSLEEYSELVRMQRLEAGWLTKESLHGAYRHMVVSDEILSQIGPAVNSGKSFLIYGQPGNGKTFIAEALFNINTTPIYIPYAIECQGQIIQVYDPIYHQPLDAPSDGLSILASAVENDFTYDKRYFRSKRPFITTGGELSLAQLDLSFNSSSRVYDAPFQLKANNGIYLIDDFGRQRVSPAEVLNRWIVPMERKIDYLNFQQGGKITVPFECFLVFSTNLNPEQLGDEAFLRRIQYKMFLKSPNEVEFAEIFEQFCNKNELPYKGSLIGKFLTKHYRNGRKKMRRCHPRDVITHAIDIIRFEKKEWELTEDVLDHAFESCFTTVNHFED